MEDLKLPLKKKAYKKSDFNPIQWHSCLPFVDNKKAILIHRPREVSTYTHFKYPYLAIKAWCGNHFTGDDKFTFMASLDGQDKLLCARCEAIATQNGLPSAEDLTGKHVHIGRLKAIRTCCKDVTQPHKTARPNDQEELMMKYVLLMSLFLTGCYDHMQCIDGQLYYNAHPYGMDNIYTKSPSNKECLVKE